MLLENKKLLITGVLTDDSMAFSAAKVAQEAGAEVLLTSVGRAVSLTQRVAKKLDPGKLVSRKVGLEDVTSVVESMGSYGTSGVTVITQY